MTGSNETNMRTGNAPTTMATTTTMQFQYNADYPTLDAADPLDFPPADPSLCARITTRIYHPKKQHIATVHNVLVRTMSPRRRTSATGNTMEMEDDSSSGDDDDRSSQDVDIDVDEIDIDIDMMQDDHPTNAQQGNEHERAYWMQRTVREAIYGRVLVATVLRKRPRDPLVDPSQHADWEVTEEQCAIKEMSWQHIRKERNKLAEDPVKEVSAMQYFKNWYQRRRGQSSEEQTTSHSSSLIAVMESNVMMPLDLLSDDRHLYSVMPYCSGGELFERLDLNERFQEEEARFWMHQILNGLENLQHVGICHRDISLENLLVHENGCLIIDMGMCLRIPFESDSLSDSLNNMTLQSDGGTHSTQMSCKKQARRFIRPQGTCGKWIYMSPEIYKNEAPFDGFAVDVWAAGVILFLMLTGFPPWERACATDERFKYMTAGYLVQMLTEWEVGLTADAMDLLQRMLFIDPKDRLCLDQVRAHPWMVNGRG